MPARLVNAFAKQTSGEGSSTPGMVAQVKNAMTLVADENPCEWFKNDRRRPVG